MNHELLKLKMERFFNETSPEHLISKFEKLGYSFIEINYQINNVEVYHKIDILNHSGENKGSWFSNLFRAQKNKNLNLDQFEVFLCKIAL